MLSSIVHKAGMGIMVAFVAVASVALHPVENAYAQDEPPARPAAEARAERLEFAYEALQLHAENMGNRLEFAPEIYDMLDRWIATLQQQGIDASRLIEARRSFEASVNEATGYYESGKAILDEGAGFDSSGNVTDVEAATGTVRAANEQLRQTRRIMSDAMFELRTVIREYHDVIRDEIESSRPDNAS